MPVDDDDSIPSGPHRSHSTSSVTDSPEVRMSRGPDAPIDMEIQGVLKPRRSGLRAQITHLETEPQTVSLRQGIAGIPKVTQGNIFRNIRFVEDFFEKPAGTVCVPQIVFPHAIVLTQACDLDNARCLLSVLLAPVYNAEHVFAGTHLSELGLSTETINKNSTRGKAIIRNNEPRYHYLHFPEGVQLPESIIDFRHYFSLNGVYLKGIRRSQWAWSVPPLWRDHISRASGPSWGE